MSDRLRHLQRQQALLREHLAWLDAEIARETGAPKPPLSGTVPSVDMPAPPHQIASNAAASSPIVDPAADELIQRYAADERQNPADIRRGCVLVFCGALALLVLTVGALWFFRYR